MRIKSEAIREKKQKKQYKKPSLKNFGHIKKITQGASGTRGDGQAGRSRL